ncbi:ammonium transporter [Methylorubrum extorquens]|jgi:Amt family ammonium transporter|uniref:Ammonium transporter n=2 Tax=Methylorubrum extorquens TaxID=408 RepID=B7KRX4_METC4|nr:ammonium transporter [Methylorubrum extorquens]KQP88702.1 ammonium transporter [Methylobacterium sp. Leaf119]ABY29700.1 ammonium transporter [Methylorubrum extorquens PA1]ACK82336.1 ammonium transporter [Methylorubrum extorquens CM4]UYW27443.1 ammonium transporter [Methylorubrum extorquens]WIU41018.1 ammonium transporter [Methylorubrum extorquens]
MQGFNAGDTAFILICTALVLMMTPALALFYGGLVRQRDVLSVMIQNFVCIGVVGLIWVFGGFSLAFGPDIGGTIGNFAYYFGMYEVGIEPNPVYAPNIPFIMVFAYQMMFAIITPALMTGAFVGRFQFGAYLFFITAWTILVYVPAAHWVWGGGFLAKLGVVDFAGGIVIHTSAGFSALATAKFLGKRRVAAGESESAPASLPLVALGAGLLWFGWFGFNAGGAYAADALAAYAFTNTMLAGSIAMLVWMFWEWRETKRPSFSGVLVGAVAGLATITPASGYVEPIAALAIGAIGATACYFAKYVQKWLKIDDTLEVWRAHGVGGLTGALLIGIMASSHINQVSASLQQFGVQLLAVLVVGAYASFVTFMILTGLDRFGTLRVPEEIQEEGLDTMLGERAFNLWNMDRTLPK